MEITLNLEDSIAQEFYRANNQLILQNKQLTDVQDIAKWIEQYFLQHLKDRVVGMRKNIAIRELQTSVQDLAAGDFLDIDLKIKTINDELVAKIEENVGVDEVVKDQEIKNG